MWHAVKNQNVNVGDCHRCLPCPVAVVPCVVFSLVSCSTQQMMSLKLKKCSCIAFKPTVVDSFTSADFNRSEHIVNGTDRRREHALPALKCKFLWQPQSL